MRRKGNAFEQTTLVEVDPVGLLSTKITLPEIVVDKRKIGKNSVTQMLLKRQTVAVEVFREGAKLLRLRDLSGINYFVKLPKARVTVEAPNVLRLLSEVNTEDIDENSELRWEGHDTRTIPTAPSSIMNSWSGSFRFKLEAPTEGIAGLRKPQLGAIHAVSSHWSISKDCATVVMPTGTGKTETMLAVLVYQMCEKVLVLVPSKTLRRQIYDKFVTLGDLRTIGAIDNSVPNPRVAFIGHRINGKSEADELLDNSNVLISTVAAINSCSDEVKKALADKCSHLFIDEAHHVPAGSWNEIKELFKEKHVLQFTATPYRRDSKPIEGEIIYDYPLGLAQSEQYFRKIKLVKLQEFDESAADTAIAKAAIEALKNDLEGPEKYKHILMARCTSKARAKEIYKIYEKYGEKYHPLLIDSELSAKDYVLAEKRLREHETQIVVCVNMLGEGFDLPALKIAAIHDPHKSLAVTLQFIGRFTRASKDVGDATVVINVNDPQVNKDLESLYSEDPDWNIILREKSASSIKTEKENHEFIKEFSGELSEHVSLWNLRPAYSTLIYSTKCDQWSPEKFTDAMPNRYKYWHAINRKEEIVVIVISKEDEVDWGKYKDIKNHSFELCVAHWSSEHQALFIQCSDYDAVNCTALARALCGEDAEVKNGEKVFNIFSGVERALARNLGISTIGNISYTMHFGTDITTGLSRVDKSQGVLNNILAWGYSDGDRFIGGCSQKSGKVWSVGGGPIFLWKRWCRKTADKIFDEAIEENKIIQDFLRPIQLQSRYRSIPLVAQWSENLLVANEDNVTVSFGAKDFKLFDVDLEIMDRTDSGPITFRVYSSTAEAVYKIEYSETGCAYQLVRGPEVSIKRRSGQPATLADYVKRDPIVVIYSDGSFSYNQYHVETPKPNNFYDRERLRSIDWSSVDVKVESMGKDLRSNSIQYRMWKILEEDDYEVIFNDDAAGEAADLIAIRRETNDAIRLHLVHCKFAKTADPTSRVDDFYTLCGQAQKSIRWKHNGFDYLYDHIKHREDTWAAEGKSRLLKGSFGELRTLRRYARYASKFNFEISIVQPGLSKAKITDDVIQLLGSTEHYLITTAAAEFNVICAE